MMSIKLPVKTKTYICKKEQLNMVGHKDLMQQFSDNIVNGRIPHAQIFEGKTATGHCPLLYRMQRLSLKIVSKPANS